jgi:hypothetical protein
MTDTRRRNSPSSDPIHRQDHEFPAAIVRNGWKYHHLGVPTKLPRPGETYLSPFGMFVSGFDTSPFGIEWMRFDETSPLPELIRTVPHLAFVVEDLDAALEGREILFPAGSPSDGVRTAMIVEDGAPVELMEFSIRS